MSMNKMEEIGLQLEAMARQIRRRKGQFGPLELSILHLKLEWCEENWPRPGLQTELKLRRHRDSGRTILRKTADY